MKKLFGFSAAVIAMTSSMAPVYAHTTGPHFSKTGDVSAWSGYGNINGNVCDATAVVTLLAPGHHTNNEHSDTASVVFTNTGAPCNAYKVEAVIDVTNRTVPGVSLGNVQSVLVTQLPSTPICAGTSYANAIEYTTDSAGNITNARLAAPITVGACVLDTDIDYVSGAQPKIVP